MSRVGDALKQMTPDRIGEVPERAPLTPVDTGFDSYPAEQARVSSALDSSRAEPLSRPGPAIVRHAATGRQRVDLDAAVRDKLVVSPHVPPTTVEQYRRLAATLHEAQTERGLKTLMVSSALPHDGKTLTVVNLALTLSESYKQRVLLIDADLRRPSVHGVLNLSNKSGLSDLLRSPEHQTPAFVEVSSHLTLLLAGRSDSNPVAGLSSGRLKEVLVNAAQMFDWVLIDTPPLGLLPDAQLVSRVSDAVLLVIGARITPYQMVQRAIAEVGEDRVIGVVLNRADNAPAAHNYYGSYYIGSETGHRGSTDG